jgi:mannose-6-phosphate isomerase-like protein (cupin superfamily)
MYPLENYTVETYFIEVRQGHDNSIVCHVCTHIYHVIDGKGLFTVDEKRYDAKPGLLFEIPPGIEFAFSGSMRLLLIMTPSWFEENEKSPGKIQT